MATAPSSAPAGAPTLTRLELNRALLDRQFLLRRTTADAAEVVTHLVGLQTQIPGNHYTALWTRIDGFSAEDFSQRFADREFVRISLQRCTIHTVTAPDCHALRPILQPMHERVLAGAFRKRLEGVDVDRAATRAEDLLHAGPLTFDEIGKALAEDWPDTDTAALGNVARNRLPLVQVPPRGLWLGGGQARHATTADWLGDPGADAGPISSEDFILRYLAAFGPASVADAQAWSGLTRLKDGFAALRADGRLAVFRDEAGTELFDLPDAPRPDGDVTAPVRFLPDYDNVFIGYKDRSRIYHPGVDFQQDIWLKNGMQPQFTVDGQISGTWRMEIDKKRTTATLTVRPLRALAAADRDAVTAEAEAVLAFWAAEAERAVRWADGG
jgi:hypothetical protein